MIILRFLSGLKLSPHRFVWLCLAVVLLLANILLASCTGLSGGTAGPAATATPAELEIAKLQWCMKPSMLFRDEEAITATATTKPTAAITPGATTTPGTTVTVTATATTSARSTPTVVPGTPRTITDWSEVKANLGFTVYLPSKLPKGTCLVNAQATTHDPIIGGSFTIAYLLPDHSALSLSEAPLVSQNTIFQCTPSNGATSQANATPKTGTPAAAPSTTHGASLLLCSGAKDTTNIVLSARGSTAYLQQFFNNLQPNLTWIPTS
jgi:hypothetical protein